MRNPYYTEFETEASEDGLSRKLWVFRITATEIVLTSVHHQSRKTKRHKFTGPKWDSHDERSYVSELPRPNYIPTLVLLAAEQVWRELGGDTPVYIGWTNETSRYASINNPKG